MKRGYRRRACLDSMLFSATKKRAAITAVRFFVRPWGVEPQSSEPESDILSIELQVRNGMLSAYWHCKGNDNNGKFKIFASYFENHRQGMS